MYFGWNKERYIQELSLPQRQFNSSHAANIQRVAMLFVKSFKQFADLAQVEKQCDVLNTLWTDFWATYHSRKVSNLCLFHRKTKLSVVTWLLSAKAKISRLMVCYERFHVDEHFKLMPIARKTMCFCWFDPSSHRVFPVVALSPSSWQRQTHRSEIRVLFNSEFSVFLDRGQPLQYWLLRRSARMRSICHRAGNPKLLDDSCNAWKADDQTLVS